MFEGAFVCDLKDQDHIQVDVYSCMEALLLKACGLVRLCAWKDHKNIHVMRVDVYRAQHIDVLPGLLKCT